MKHFALFLCILLLFPVVSTAESFHSSVDSTGELYPVQIPEKSVCVNPGTYSIGDEIPAGSYQIDVDCDSCQIITHNIRDYVMFKNDIGTKHGCTRIVLQLVEGYTITIKHDPVYFSPASDFDFSLVLPGMYIVGADISEGTYSFSSESSTVFVKPNTKLLFSTIEIDTQNVKVDLPPDTVLVVEGDPVVISEYIAPSFNWE